MEFKDKLKTLLDERQMKPVDLARSTELSESIISYYLSGKKEPKGRTCFKIAKALSITVDELLDSPFAESERIKQEKEITISSVSKATEEVYTQKVNISEVIEAINKLSDESLTDLKKYIDFLAYKEGE